MNDQINLGAGLSDGITELSVSSQKRDKVFRASLNLRWNKAGNLQQLWVDWDDGDLQWRDIPIEKEEG